MDYEKHYAALIYRARDRELGGYTEKHHVLPKCLGGGNEKENIVKLTPEEHYLAHLLLVKMHPGHKGLHWAAMAMTNSTLKMNRSQNKRYGWLRRRFVEKVVAANKGRVVSSETKAKMSATRLGVKRSPHTDATKSKMSAASKGRCKSKEHCKSLSKAKLGKKRQPHSEETKQKIKLSNSCRIRTEEDLEVYRTPEYKLKQSVKMKEIWAKRKAQKFLTNTKEF